MLVSQNLKCHEHSTISNSNEDYSVRDINVRSSDTDLQTIERLPSIKRHRLHITICIEQHSPAKRRIGLHEILRSRESSREDGWPEHHPSFRIQLQRLRGSLRWIQLSQLWK